MIKCTDSLNHFKRRISESEYKKLVNAHNLQSSQMHMLQIRLNDALKLEETCRRQEIVM